MRVEQVNAPQFGRSASPRSLAFKSEWAVAGAWSNRLVWEGVVVLGSSMFGGRVTRHQLWHFHKTSIEQAARSRSNQQQRNCGCPDESAWGKHYDCLLEGVLDY